MKKPLIVLKFGTSSITRNDGSLDEQILVEIVRQVAELHNRYRILLVSSGAVGCGKGFLKNFQGSLTDRKAAAAIGNPLLINTYSNIFAHYGIPIAQSLCERRHFSERKQFLQLRNTLETLWENGVIPIANENDVVSDLELQFSDNDELATLMAVGFEASALLIGTSVAGLLDQQGSLVQEVSAVDQHILGMARKEKSTLGLGGMTSKLTFARLATRMGIKVVVFGIRKKESIWRAIEGKTGTLFHPQASSLSARNKWLASGSLVNGWLKVDEGAQKALLNRKSLLAVGIVEVADNFEKGEVIEILGPSGERFAVARARYSSQETQTHIGQPKIAIAHADDIVLI